ncbi:bifunctional folylpolyglutamate synthase/dihydrofolate synthase [Micropruina sp.]|uniref:bifunctional folylpolyglutamate synthase/dihydrofolate synthase n=1 Tax=Micropruina sp. TaxID=2737536 RepID=UPI0039E24547
MPETHHEIAQRLISRWPEHRIAPGTARVEALCELLGSPQRAYPVIQIAGTNGKGSTAIMIDALLRALGLRTGRYTSPHLIDLTERISIDGEPMSADAFDELVAQTQPLIDIVDAQAIDGVSMTFFEVMTALAYAAFAEAPVDVAVVEVGLGGVTDATNVMDAQVAVICPIDYDHTHLLGDSLAEIAAEKAGIIKPGAQVVLAAQQPEAAAVLIERCADVGARVYREGVEFGLLERTPAVGGQVLRIDSAGGPVGDLLLPLFGEHMARNAAVAVAAVEAFLGGKPLAPDIIAEALAAVVAPARLEIVRRSPTVVLDTCHNPHGARATIAAVTEAFAFTPLIGVVAVMADKDVTGLLEVFAEEMTTIVCTTVAGTGRALSAEALAERAAEIVGPERVRVAPAMADAIDVAVGLADEAGAGAGVLIAGSVIAAGQARALLVREESR